MFEIGRVCMKTAGREAGKYCVVVKKEDENFVMVTGPRSITSVKRRRCNINHLEPLTEKINIKSDASDADVLKAYQDASVFVKLGLEKPKKTKEHVHEKKEHKERHEKKEHTHKHEHKEHKEHAHKHDHKEHKHEKKETKKPAKKPKAKTAKKTKKK